MYTGYLISESFKNPEFLNKLNVKNVKVEYFKNAKGTGTSLKVWHLFKIVVSEKNIEKISKMICNKIKVSWYAHFYNKKKLYLILTDKIFVMPMEENFKSKEYQEAFKYSVTKGKVEKKYTFKKAKEII
jgi:hypothetical protein